MTTIQKCFLAYQKGKITRDEMYKFQSLHKDFYGENGCMFCIIREEDNEAWNEYDRILAKF